MNKKDKDLLLKDLCARLPYGVICKCYHTEFDEWDGKPFVAIYNETLRNIDVDGFFLAGGFNYEIDEVKPFLRPMSSMTEEEKKYLMSLKYQASAFKWKNLIISSQEITDWLNRKMFDYRGLIKKGLAIEVTEKNNPYKE